MSKLYIPTAAEIDEIAKRYVNSAKTRTTPDGRVLQPIPDRDLYELRIGVKYFAKIQMTGYALSHPEAEETLATEVNRAMRNLNEYIERDIYYPF